MFPILVMSQSYLATRCEDDTNSSYTPGSQFQNNLKGLLDSLYDRGSNFAYQTTQGSYPDKVYGLFICRGDLSTDTCQDCIDVGNGKIQSDCQYKKEGTIWYDECVIRYSHTSFFGIPVKYRECLAILLIRQLIVLPLACMLKVM